jgi:hypothetical protein
MAINYLTTANTFQQWLIGTQDLITVANNLTDNISGTFYANTNLVVGNTLNVVGDTTISGNLTVSGNIVLDTIGFDDINANGSINVGNTLFVTGNSTFSNANVTNTLTTSTIRSSSGLLTVSSNTLVNDWAFSPNANVKSGVTTFSVINSGSSAYLFDQYSGNNPDIYLHPGQTVSFNINATGHPFLIRLSNAGALYNVGLTHVSTAGVVTTEGSAQGQVSGTLIWKVPFSLTGNTYVYQCQNHSVMVGNLIIQSTVTAAITTANAAFLAANNAASDGLAFAVALG